MPSDEKIDVQRELAVLRERLAEREALSPVSPWTPADRAASREDAQRVKRLMQYLIDSATEF